MNGMYRTGVEKTAIAFTSKVKRRARATATNSVLGATSCEGNFREHTKISTGLRCQHRAGNRRRWQARKYCDSGDELLNGKWCNLRKTTSNYEPDKKNRQ